MNSRVRKCARLLGLAALACWIGGTVGAQEKQHVVSSAELQRDSAQSAETRRANEQAVRTLLSSDAGKRALGSARVEYQKVDKAVGQLSDEDLARLAQRSRQAQNDFAAGTLSDRDLLWIILIIVAVLIIALAVR
jgi:hypothetical protein